MTERQTWAWRFRFVLLFATILCWFALILFAIEPLFGWKYKFLWGYFGVAGLYPNETGYMIMLVMLFAVMLSTQWLLLRPARGWRPKLTETSRPMKTAIVTASLMAALVSVGMIATMLELMGGLWIELTNLKGGYFAEGWVTGLIIVVIVWITWAAVFAILWKGRDRFKQIHKFIRVLIAGSFLETLIAASVFAWNPHHEDCHCARGSYTGMVLGGTVMFWAFGPGLVLLFLSEKYRRERLFNLCHCCSYDLRGCLPDAIHCPECGEDISDQALSRSMTR